ncbi:MAG TPA: ATP-binding protein [Polyangia bacterium]|jgi:signal transduction histidine kinase/DNA-binding response OmpR family regulator|nr:ATP-binding protein [Polyangia bacterium]
MAEARILNVNDDEPSRDIVTRVLAHAGFDVVEAATGRDALRALTTSPDLVILDVQLPDLDGYEVARRIRANPSTRQLPVLHLSAAVEPEARVSGLNAGADGYLAQPVEPDVLIATVRSILQARRVERELVQSLGQSNVILQSIADAVTAQDATGALVYANDAALRLLRIQSVDAWNAAKLLADFEILDEHGKLIDLEQLPGRRVLRGEPEARTVICWRRRGRGHGPGHNEDDRWTVAQARPVYDVAGHVQLAITILHDITAERRATERLSLLTEASATLSASLDYATTLARVAELPLPMLGEWSVVHLVDGDVMRRSGHHVDPTKQSLLDEMLAQPRSADAPPPSSLWSGRVTAEIYDRTLEARVDPADLERARTLGLRAGMTAPLTARGQTFGALTVLSGRLRRYEPADLALLRDLAHRAALAIDNARVLQQAEEAAELRRDLVAIVAHDLKNPLNAIGMAGSLLSRQAAPGADGDRARRQSSIITRACERMNRLIHDLLDVSAIDAGRLELDRQRIGLGGLMTEALEAIAPLAQERSIALVRQIDASDEELEVLADRERLLQVLANLLGNAVKFTDEGGTVMLRGGRGALGLEVAVSDTGCGIAPEHVPHVFDRYWRVGTQNRAGTGLGLSIVKGIIDAHGGMVSVDTTPGRGSTFTFSIPLA